MIVLTGQGMEAAGDTIETEGPTRFVVQKFDPSKARPIADPPRLLATVVTAPAACVGSIL